VVLSDTPEQRPHGSTATSSADAHVGGPWVDNHCHLELERGDDGAHAAMGRGPAGGPGRAAALVDAARDAGVVALVTVGTDAESSRHCIELAGALDGVWATAGVHPHEATEGTGALRRVLEERSPGLVAIGECGLDYHYDHSPREVQRRVFAEQVRMAHEHDLPLVIHTREAWEDTFAVLDTEGIPARTVFHCFTGGPGEAERCVERGALLSISGIVTFPSARELREAVQRTPLDRLMVETDSPYLAPVPHRGRPNVPAFVGLVGAAVAELHGQQVAEVARSTTSNAESFYGLDLG
jgi:TatD DNase family protein